MAAGILDGHAEALLRKACELALAGDVQCLRLTVERILPAAKAQRHLDGFALPAISSAADLPGVVGALMAGLTNGDLALGDLPALTALITASIEAHRVADLDARIAALEHYVNLSRPHHADAA
jgi:hypothetical protein